MRAVVVPMGMTPTAAGPRMIGATFGLTCCRSSRCAGHLKIEALYLFDADLPRLLLRWPSPN